MAAAVVLFQDPCLLVIDKPAGVAAHRGWARDPVVAMDLAREAAGRYVYPLHRLDRAASGALAFALDRATARAMMEGFARGEIQKRYLAVVRGMAPESGRIDHPLAREKGAPAAPAVTEFRRLSSGRLLGPADAPDPRRISVYSVVEAAPSTGRRHQIRRHFKHLGHPLLGDVRYGRGEHNRYAREHFGWRRLALHAVLLRFTHPATGAEVEVRAPVPADMAGLIAAIR